MNRQDARDARGWGEALAAATGTDAIRDVLRACDRALREGREGTVDDVDQLVEILLPYARHPHARVRQEIAEMCDRFPEPGYGDAIAILEKDVDPYVRSAVERAVKRRAVQKKESTKVADHDQALADILAEIEAKHDVAARRLAERAVRIALDQRAAHLHHELGRQRQPLEVALSMLSAEIARPEPAKGALVERFARLTKTFDYVWSILRRTRTQATRAKATFEDCSLLDVVEQARLQVGQALGEKAAGVHVGIEIERELRLDVDRHALMQAVENVLKNAVEACAAAGRVGDCVRVRGEARSRGSEIAIVIADDGPGMTEGELARVFVPFGSVKPGGTGVGMVTAREMIQEVHGGEMTVESAVGEGTRVTMVVAARR